MPEALRAPVISQASEPKGEVELPADVFAAPLRSHLLYETVKMQLANRRAGTHATKTRAFVSGGGKKPWRQKGTGRARQGSIRATQWVGGATVFGPQPRDYSYHLPASGRSQAVRTALSAKMREGKIILVDQLDVPSGKTKDFVKTAAALGFRNALVLVGRRDDKVQRAVRNVPGVKLLDAVGVNVYDILAHEHLVITVEALEILKERLSS